MAILGDKIRDKLKKVSYGEPHTWGFVAMFVEMIEEAEKETDDELTHLRTALRGLVDESKRLATKLAENKGDITAHDLGAIWKYIAAAEEEGK